MGALTKYDWDKISKEYIEAVSENVRPSLDSLAKKYGVSSGYIEQKCAKDKWVEQSKKFISRVSKESQAQKIRCLSRSMLLSENLFDSNNSSKKGFTQSDFDKAISDLKSQITELKAKYPQFTQIKTKDKFRGVHKNNPCQNSWRSEVFYKGELFSLGSFRNAELAARTYDLKAVELRGEGCTTNFAVEDIKTKVLFPDYPATKRHEATVLTAKPVELVREPIQLTIATDDDATDDDNQCETIYDRMRAFAAQNGIEIKTMQT